MLLGIRNFLKKTDLFSVEPQLYLYNKQKYGSSLGGIISMIMVFTMIMVSMPTVEKFVIGDVDMRLLETGRAIEAKRIELKKGSFRFLIF